MPYNLGNDYKTFYFIGIGGIHMSGMAVLLKEAGYNVKGSDQKRSKATDKLESAGIQVFIGHKEEHIASNTDIDLVVYTVAVPPSNPELIAARRLGIPAMERPEMLGLIMKNYMYPICISGTHGKTTTTSMLTEMMIKAKKNPTSIIGGILPSINGSLLIGSDEFFIAESCEYYDAFLKFFPYIGVILNVELDHTDYFGTLSKMRESFAKFAKRIRNDGTLVIYKGIDNADEFISGLPCKVITFGTEDSDWKAENIAYNDMGYASFDVFYKNNPYAKFSLSVPGKQHILNALASIAVCNFFTESGLSEFASSDIQSGLFSYTGTNRRFQYKGEFCGVKVYDDYCHHPTEISVNIDAACKIPHNKLWCVFQPHTKRRTAELLDSFAECFNGADYVVLLDIYSPVGREENDCEIHSLDLYNKLKLNGINAHYFSSFSDAENFIRQNSVPNDMLITMGAGDVVLLGETMVSSNEK